jgi:hypothetical protein
MRNPYAKKLREYRKALRGAKGYISLWKLFDHIHPEWDKNPHRWFDPNWRIWHDQVDNIRDDWFRRITRQPIDGFHGMGNAPAHFRRDLNRNRRNKEKQAIRDAMAGNIDWDEFSLPRFRRNANWLWW